MLPDQFDLSDVGEDVGAEDAARLHGVMAMLALPEVRCDDGTFRRREVDIEIAPGKWQRVDGVSVEAERVVFFFGVNGHRQQWVFVKGERVPRWRCDANVPRRSGPRFGSAP